MAVPPEYTAPLAPRLVVPAERWKVETLQVGVYYPDFIDVSISSG
jgi:hypothetical protein